MTEISLDYGATLLENFNCEAMNGFSMNFSMLDVFQDLQLSITFLERFTFCLERFRSKIVFKIMFEKHKH